MRELKTQGFILKKIPYQNEKTRLFSVMTKDFGKIVLSAPESKKLQSSMKIMSPLNICEFEIYKSGNGHYKVKHISLIQSLLKHDGDRLETVQKLYILSELIHMTLEEGEKNERLYRLLIGAAIVIKETDSDLVFEAFKTKLLDIHGNLPHLKHCFTCKTKCCNDDIWISEETLHIQCKGCISKYDTSTHTQLCLDSLKLLHYISGGNFEEILRVKAHEKALKTLASLNDLLLGQLLHCELKSLQKSLIHA